MELGTFGAILGFALEIEQQAAEFYQVAAQGEAAGLYQELAQKAQKRLRRVERARREGVQEMILESISGLDSDDYTVESFAEAGEIDLLNQAIALEERARRFYEAAATKMPIRGVARMLQRMAKENDLHKGKLAEFIET
jgi:rubrerythrin